MHTNIHEKELYIFTWYFLVFELCFCACGRGLLVRTVAPAHLALRERVDSLE